MKTLNNPIIDSFEHSIQYIYDIRWILIDDSPADSTLEFEIKNYDTFKKDKSEASDNQSYIYYLCFITVISLYILFLLIYFKFCFSKINLNILNDNKEGSHLTIREFTVEVEGFPKNTTYYDLKEYVEMLQKDLDYKIVKVSTVFKNKNIYNDLNNIGIKIFRINKAAEIYKVKVEKNTKMKKLEAIKKQIIKKKEKTKIKISNFLKKYNLNEKILNLNIIKKKF